MINKKVIEKLSDRELENYLRPDSRFMPVAIRHAYEILQARGKTFSEEESRRIQQMINQKTTAEKTEQVKYSKGWDKNITTRDTAIELYTNKFIWVYSILFGVPFGAVLQAMNFHRLKNAKGIYITILFGILYTIFQIVLLTYLEDIGYKIPNGTFLFSGIGAAGLFYIREKLTPKHLEYRSRSYILPVIIAVIVYIPLIYIIITGMLLL